jgi:hypothetical protein
VRENQDLQLSPAGTAEGLSRIASRLIFSRPYGTEFAPWEFALNPCPSFRADPFVGSFFHPGMRH